MYTCSELWLIRALFRRASESLAHEPPIYINIYIYVLIYIYLCVCICMYVYVFIYIYTCSAVRLSFALLGSASGKRAHGPLVYTYIYIYTYVYIYTYLFEY